MKNCQSTIIVSERNRQLARDRYSEAWRNSKELAVFGDTMCVMKYGRQLLEKSWCVQL